MSWEFDVPASESVDDDVIVHYIAEMNDREDPEEGMVPHRVRRFARFERRMVSLDWFRPEEEEEMVSPSLVREYQNMSKSTEPPIVVDGVERSIIDGFHRFNAARARGDSTILAYVGVEPRAEWRPFDEDFIPCQKPPGFKL